MNAILPNILSPANQIKLTNYTQLKFIADRVRTSEYRSQYILTNSIIHIA